MSNHLLPKKKQHVAPLKLPPQAGAGLLLARTTQLRATTGCASATLVSSLTKGSAAASSNPTPAESSRKPTVAPATFGLCAACMPAPDFKAATEPQSSSRKIHTLGSNEGEDDLDDEDKSNASDADDELEEKGSEEEEDKGKGLGKEGEDKHEGGGSDKDAGGFFVETKEEFERLVCQQRTDFKACQQRAAAKSQAKPTRPTSGPTASKKESVVHTNKEAVDVGEKSVDEAYYEGLIKGYSRATALLLFGFKMVMDAVRDVCLYNNEDEPVWFKLGTCIAIPHFNRSFEENFGACDNSLHYRPELNHLFLLVTPRGGRIGNGRQLIAASYDKAANNLNQEKLKPNSAWGPKLYELIADESCMEDEELWRFLSSVPRKKFCDALPTGA
ncbi:hypothetical protein FRC07_002022 [Ceratobasidium sp. 392]|nr:hypothetical protein FRC07_002022 [Ceratobasidium sp. 392]